MPSRNCRSPFIFKALAGPIFCASILSAADAHALVLCAPAGELSGSIVEGGQVVIRTTCASGETLVPPFILGGGGNLQEVVQGSKDEVVGSNSVSAIGGNREISIGGSDTIAIGGDRTLATGGDIEQLVGGDLTDSIGGDQSVTISENSQLTVGKTLSISVEGGLVQQVGKDASLSSKRLTLTAEDELMLRTGSASIMMKKNGDITIQGRRITIKGQSGVAIKGKKIAEN